MHGDTRTQLWLCRGILTQKKRGTVMWSCVVPMNLSLKCVAKHRAAKWPLSHPLSIHSHRSEAFWTKAAGVYALVD